MLYIPNNNPAPFVGRNEELKLLNRLRESSKAELLILYGRRRVGKTRLLTNWLHTPRPRVLFWTAEPTSRLDQLRSFSQAVSNFRHPDMPVPAAFTYASWEHVFRELAQLAQDERLVVILDEFTYLLEIEPGSWKSRTMPGPRALLPGKPGASGICLIVSYHPRARKGRMPGR